MSTISDINWQLLVRDLRSKGLSYRRIAEAAGMSHEQVRKLGDGRTREPGYNNGQRLLAVRDAHQS